MSLIQMSFYGAVLVLVVLGIRCLFLNKLPKRVFPILWLIVLARLLLPVSIPSELSVYSVLEPGIASLTDAFTQPESSKTEMMQEVVEETAISETKETRDENVGAIVSYEMEPELLFKIFWLAGVVLSAGFLLAAYIKYRREFADSLPVEQDVVKEWLGEHSFFRKVTIRQSAKVEAPLTFGVFRPVILMPVTVDWTDEEKLSYILTHEMIHIRRFDGVIKFLMNAAFCIHWFNPLVWVMAKYLNRDLELSCDEAVLRLSGESKKAEYARTLISMEEKKSGLYLLGSGFSKNAIEERIKAIMKMKKCSLIVIVLAVLLVAAVAIGFGTSSDGQSEEEKAIELAFDKYIELSQMHMTVWVKGPKLEDIIITSETCPDGYVKVEDERFTSIADIKAATEEVCTEKYARQAYYKSLLDSENPVYEEREDGLYRLMCELPSVGGWEEGGKQGQITVMKLKTDYIKVKFYYEVDENRKTEEIFLTLVKQDEKWLVDDYENRITFRDSESATTVD